MEYRFSLLTRILDTLIENAVNHSKIVATEIIDDILKGAVKTDNNSTKRKHSVTDKTFVTWKEKFPCIVFLLQVYQALKMYTSGFILLMYIILYSLNVFHWCR
jgi:hypothetical protein